MSLLSLDEIQKYSRNYEILYSIGKFNIIKTINWIKWIVHMDYPDNILFVNSWLIEYINDDEHYSYFKIQDNKYNIIIEFPKKLKPKINENSIIIELKWYSSKTFHKISCEYSEWENPTNSKVIWKYDRKDLLKRRNILNRKYLLYKTTFTLKSLLKNDTIWQNN